MVVPFSHIFSVASTSIFIVFYFIFQTYQGLMKLLEGESDWEKLLGIFWVLG